MVLDDSREWSGFNHFIDKIGIYSKKGIRLEVVDIPREFNATIYSSGKNYLNLRFNVSDSERDSLKEMEFERNVIRPILKNALKESVIKIIYEWLDRQRGEIIMRVTSDILYTEEGDLFTSRALNLKVIGEQISHKQFELPKVL